MNADVIVVGSGIVGMASAWADRHKGPSAAHLAAGLEQEMTEFIQMTPEPVAASVQNKP